MIRKNIEAFRVFISRVASAVTKVIDERDCFVFGGIGLLGYGLWLYRPWIGFAVCGAVLLFIGLFVPGTGKGKA